MTSARRERSSVLRLIADDLTGALGTAAELVASLGPVRVIWGESRPLAGGRIAFACGTREASAEQAAATVARTARALDLGASTLAVLTFDSLLRGHAGAEIAACAATGAFDSIVVAPAFPFQKRVTRRGHQWAQRDGALQPTGEDLTASLTARGLPLALRRAGDAIPRGVSLWDVETDADLDVIATAGRAAAERGTRLLWCGSGGLAGALGRSLGGVRRDDSIDLPAPILGLFGTDHPATTAQLAHAGETTLRLPDGSAASADRISRRLAQTGAALVVFDLPRLSGSDAHRRIAAELTALTGRLVPPATLIAGGGETLRALCEALGADALTVTGRIMPGVPVAELCGGRWQGVRVVFKSGAFGEVDVLTRLTGRAVPAGSAGPMAGACRSGSKGE